MSAAVQDRDYDPTRDHDAAARIWAEVGWLPGTDTRQLDAFLAAANHVLVSDVAGQPECLVMAAHGTIRHQAEDLTFAGITGVTTSRVARKLGLARRLVAALLARAAEAGALVAGLGMFEQGFYDQVGFGTCAYGNWVGFDPAHLRVDRPFGVPCRLGVDDWAACHAARLARHRGHGSISFDSAEVTHGDLVEHEHGFGLGYRDGDGALTHAFWAGAAPGEHGPYEVHWTAWQTPDQLLELLALLHGLGDQVRLVKLLEPAGVQLQDLVDKPFRALMVTAKGSYETRIECCAETQLRILDVPGCLARTHLRGVDLRFNLVLTDPVTPHLPPDAAWRGAPGEWRVTLGPDCTAEPGSEPALPTLRAPVGAFSRLWMGVRPATGLAVTDDLSGPDELLDELDHAFRLPAPAFDWPF